MRATENSLQCWAAALLIRHRRGKGQDQEQVRYGHGPELIGALGSPEVCTRSVSCKLALQAIGKSPFEMRGGALRSAYNRS